MRLILYLVLVGFLLIGAVHGTPDRDVVQASEILAKIERGEPVEYADVIIEGDLDINGTDLPINQNGKFIVVSPISITYSEIQGRVNFRNTIFQNETNFEGSHLCGICDFRGAVFTKNVYYLWCEFINVTNFQEVYVGRNAIFSDAVFQHDAIFREAKFDGDAKFTGVIFKKYADFGNTQFEGDASFNNAQSDGDINFTLAAFNDPDFRGFSRIVLLWPG